MSKKSMILIFIQFTCFAYFLFDNNLLANNYLIALQFIGFVVAIWGVIVMKIGNFNVQPEVKMNAQFITKGPYKIIRNPMYCGLILFFSINIISNFSFFSFGILSILIITFLTKINMEEDFLSQRFGEKYETYKKKTYRLIPYVY